MILKHQCRVVAHTLEGNYDVDFPLYETMKDAMESGYSEEEAKLVALDGPLFAGQRSSDSVIYGDTDSTYFKTYADNVEDATKIADRVAARVNASYEGFMRETFLCTPGFDNLVKAGREIVSDRGIFVEKKRYILHLVDLDGKKVDKMKVMGLDTKKTTLPAEVSGVLNRFIERFLKGESWESVSASIVEYKEELMSSTDPMRIGLPKGVKKIESYTAAFEEDFEARLPGHVAAAIYYNQSLKEYKDKVSMAITSGMKIKVFYLIGKHGKFKSIALPTDVEVVPQWFLDNFRIDRDAHIERLVDNPLSNILKAIGKEPPSKQSMYADSLLVFD
jgi:DNA polymerase elongation subunit (family B)